jgi:Tfp pilus assembly protein PilX
VNRRIAKDLFLGERGIALPMALGIMMVLSIALVTVLELSSSGQRSSNISKAEQVALAVAEAGLNEAHAVLANASDPTSSSALPASCDTAPSPDVTAEGGTACYWGSLAGSTWTVSAKSTVQNPSGGAAITHVVSEQVAVSSSPATTANNPAWNYIYSDSPTGCMILQSSVQIKQKVYVKNDLCLGSSARIYAEAQEVSVEGEINVDSSAWIGQGTPLPTLNLGSTSAGCRKGAFDSNGNPIGGGSFSYPCTAAGHQVNATTQNHTVPDPPVTKPPVDIAARYADAKPGPSHPCTSSTGVPPTFDNNSLMDNTSPTVSLIGAAYSCSVAGGGSITWVPGDPGTLTVNGTIYFDGDIVMVGSAKARIVGRGTVYTSGRVVMDSSIRLCGVFSGSECNFTAGVWDPDVNLLTLVAGSGTSGLPSDTYAIELNSSVQWQGAFYAVGDYLQTSSAVAQGPVVANQIHYDSSTGTVAAPFDELTPGAPSNSSGAATLTRVAGSWRG